MVDVDSMLDGHGIPEELQRDDFFDGQQVV